MRQYPGFGLRRFWHELRRRRVLRTAALYIVGAWVLLQVADVVIPGLGIPGTAIKWLIWVTLLGFPVALVFGWLFDIGAHGIRRTPAAATDDLASAPPLRRNDFLILGAFAALAAALLYSAIRGVLMTPADQAVTPSTTDRSVETPLRLENSVAVLPFVNMSSDPENEYFCDGMSEEILNSLSRYPELNVIGRTSSFAFKRSDYGVPRISELLGVHFLLQGSVRKSGNELRIAADLLDETGRQVWTQTFDRQLANVFDIQTEIAEAVANNVAARVTPPASEENPPDIRAYELYLAGREFQHQREPGKERSIEALERAIAIDPDFAEAYAELAVSQLINFPTTGQEDQVRENIDRALQLKPKLLRAQAAAGLLLLEQQKPDLAAAESILRKVLSADPNMSDALVWLSNSLVGQGRDDEAFAVLERAIRIDPFHPAIAPNLATLQDQRGETDRAIQLLERQLEQPQVAFSTFITLRDILQTSGRLVDMNRVAKSAAIRVHGPQYLSLVASYAVLGNYSAAAYWIERTRRDFPTWWSLSYTRASIPEWQGHHEEALALLREGFDPAGSPPASSPPLVHVWYGALLARAGHASEAIDVLVPLVSPGNPIAQAWMDGLDEAHALAWAYLHTGDGGKAKALLAQIDRRCGKRAAAGRLHNSRDLFYCAENALLRNDIDRALDLFDSAVTAGWRDYYLRQNDPYWASLRDNARFRELMARVKADVDRQREEVARIDAREDFVKQLDAALAAREAGP